jgi:hypothetical protein
LARNTKSKPSINPSLRVPACKTIKRLPLPEGIFGAENQLMPALKNPSLVVLDNASYHNVKTEDAVCPNFSQKQAVLQNYLTQHNIPFSATDTKKSITVYMKK